MTRGSTQLESIDEIRQALRKRTQSERTPTSLEADAAPITQQAERFRPVSRPSMAIVTVLFDGLDEGERIAVRGNSCIVGRTEGRILISNDSAISSKHFELYL